MDIFLLDTNYNRIDIIDDYTSFIWSERQTSPGDFELQLSPSKRWSSLSLDRMITHPKTNEAMIIESRYETTNKEGERLLVIKGRTLDVLLERRSVIPAVGKGFFPIKAMSGDAIRNLITRFAMSKTELGDDRDIIPGLTTYVHIPDTTIIDFAVQPQSLYKAIKDICDLVNCRFGISLRNDNPRLRFYAELGVERNVYFSTKLDTLADTSYIHSKEKFYNTAYIWSRDGLYRTTVGTYPGWHTGVNRRVLSIYASDLDVDETTSMSTLISQMKQRGYEELAKHKEARIFDGKTTGADSYVYGTHYKLGDIVTLIGDDDRQQKVRVSEYIFSQDREGLKSYPSFTSLEEGET